MKSAHPGSATPRARNQRVPSGVGGVEGPGEGSREWWAEVSEECAPEQRDIHQIPAQGSGRVAGLPPAESRDFSQFAIAPLKYG